MNKFDLENMIGGWFIGGFSPAALNSTDCEVAVKRYLAGHSEPLHVHKVATEVTVIVEGEAKMSGCSFKSGDIVVIAPGEPTDFEAITNVLTVVVKTPSVKDDKFFV